MADSSPRNTSTEQPLSPIEPSGVYPTAPSNPDALQSRTASSSTARLSRLFCARHLDISSVYHSNDITRGNRDSSLDNECDILSEITINEEDSGVGSDGGDAVPGRSRIEKDVEAPLGEKRTRSIKDPNLVSWSGEDDPENPKNWTLGKKWAATVIVSSFTFISPVTSSMVAPALTAIAQDFGIKSDVESQLVLSVFVLAFALGPLLLGPLSEIYGRVPVLQLSNLFYLIFNIAGGFAQNKAQMVVFRFLSGLGGSAPLAASNARTLFIGGGVLSDCWRADERGLAISIYSLAPLLGPAVGPIAGGFITENTSWRWAFHATSIADAVIQVFGLFFLRETYPPELLHQKAKKLRRETGNAALRTEFEHPERSFSYTMKRSLIRPFKLLGTQPIIQLLACYMAYLYGIMYLVLSTFPVLWTTKYHESVGIGGLNYISLAVGFFLGTQISAPLNDRIYRRLTRRNNGAGQPEFRVPIMVPGSVLVPAGLFIYGWTAQYQVHWIVPNIGAAIFSAGTIVGFQCIQTYLVDAYTRWAASAIGAATVLRSLAGFGFPLFAPYMYNALDYGWGNSLLGFIAVALGTPAPFLLWIYGSKLRQKSPFAAGGT